MDIQEGDKAYLYKITEKTTKNMSRF